MDRGEFVKKAVKNCQVGTSSTCDREVGLCFERRDGEVRVEYARDLGATGREEPRLLCDAVPVMCTGGRDPLGWVVTKQVSE